MKPTSRQTRIGLLLFGALAFLAGCTTTIQPARVAAFGQGVDAVKLQYQQAFTAINQLTMDDAVEFAATQPTLNESEVGVVLKAEDIAKWDMAIGQVDAYVANLTLLLSPDQANNFSAAATQLGSSLAKLDPQALPSPGVAAGFIELGRLLIEAKAQSDAIKAAQIADPGIQKIFTEMAAVIGANNQTALRGTAAQHWQLRMGNDQAAFVGASASARKPIAQDYAGLIQKRDAQDVSLALLHDNLLNVGKAHAALARGSDVDLAGAIGAIGRELDAAQSLVNQFSALAPPPPPPAPSKPTAKPKS